MNAATFFNPQGRMTKGQFQMAVLVLLVLGFINSLSPLISAPMAAMAVGSLSVLVALVLCWMWIAIWVKRLHQGGVTGWMTILIVMGWGLIYLIMTTSVQLVADPSAMDPASSTSFAEIMAASAESARKIAIPVAIADTILTAVFALGLNAVLPSHTEENQYGLPPA